jgi:hypothetical protein
MAEDKQKPKQPLSAKLGLIGGITFGVLASTLFAPRLFPKAPGQSFSVAQMLFAGAAGALGATLGFLIGRLIEGPPKQSS